ncbi:MAG: FAD-dependent thymidylate synthase, partial [bacterium]
MSKSNRSVPWTGFETPLWTLQLRYPRFIHSEFMTHRMFSRNASSSRAIPVSKMIEQVETDPAKPMKWGKNQPGMQASEELSPNEQVDAEVYWVGARDDALHWASHLLDLKVHKQIANRLLEPFQWIDVIVTATEWTNFFKLRNNPAAQPEMQQLAKTMLEAMTKATLTKLDAGDYHLPYVSTEERETLDEKTLVAISAARCARVSYRNHDNSEPDIGKDLELAQRLLEGPHASPFEHQATPMTTRTNLSN